MFGLRDDEFAAAAQDANRFRLDQRLVRQRIGRVNIDETTLGLRHDLLGDDETVAVLKVGVVGGGDQFGEVVARADLTDVVDGDDLEIGHGQTPVAASWQAWASAAATPGCFMMVGMTIGRIPASSTAEASSRSTSSITSVAASSR